jgi:hypothetical protein
MKAISLADGFAEIFRQVLAAIGDWISLFVICMDSSILCIKVEKYSCSHIAIAPVVNNTTARLPSLIKRFR